MYDAWDIMVVISLTHATNGDPTHHAQVPCNEQTPHHLFFDFLKEKKKTQKALTVPPSNPRIIYQKKDKSSSYLFFDFSM